MGSQSQQFCLRWNNHQMNMLNVFDQLLHNGDFVDVTLSCSGGNIKAHKMVLSACSPYFQELFRENPCKHPIVILKDMKMVELRSIVDFMYKGEINVSQDQLPTLLKTAESLKVKGLAEVSSSGSGSANEPAPTTGTDSNANVNGNAAINQGFAGENSAVQSEGRASPPPKRKRHRPARKPSNDDSNEEQDDGLETPKEASKTNLLKNEPLEVNDPQIDLLDEDQFPRLDSMDNQHDRSNDGNSRLSHSDMLEMSQPSTSGTHGSSAGLGCTAKLTYAANSGSASPTVSTPPRSNFIPWVRSPCRSGPCKTWQEETMFTAVRAVLKMGAPLIDASRRYSIPYPTLFYYTSRVRHLLRPEDNSGEESSPSEVQVSVSVVRSRSTRNRRVVGSHASPVKVTTYYRNEAKMAETSSMMKKIREHRQMIRKAMHTVFTHEEMATHSLTGRKAFGNEPLPALDPNKVSLVFEYLHRQLSQFGGSIIKQAMAQVLVCERRLYDRRSMLVSR